MSGRTRAESRRLGARAEPRRAGTLAIAALLALATVPAFAQLVDTYFPSGLIGYRDELGVTVGSRARPEFDPEGIRAGSFILRPDLGTGFGFASNPTGHRPARGSPFASNTGQLRVNSNWSSDNVAALFTVEDRRYLSLPSQSYTNWSGSLAKVFNLGASDKLLLGVEHLNLNQIPTAINTQTLDRPGAYRIDQARIAYETSLGDFNIQPQLSFTTYRYDAVLSNRAILRQANRNRDVVDAQIVTKYSLAPLHDLLLVLRGASIHYVNPDRGVPTKDANAVAVLAGIDLAADAVWRLRALAGYQVRSFRSAGYRTASAPIAEVNVTFQPSGLTTVTGTLTRSIEDAAAETSGSFTSTLARITIDHELTRNILLNAHADVQTAEYQGGGAETYTTMGTSVTWLMDRNLRLVGSYDYINKRPVTGSNLVDNQILMKLMIGL